MLTHPATLDPVSAPRQATHRRSLAVLSIVLLLGIAFIVDAALPYFALDPANFKVYWPRRWWLMAHLSAGIVALLSGPVQLWLGFTNTRPHLHRRIGITYVTSVAIGAFAGFYLAFKTDYGLVFGAGLTGLALAWVVTTGLAVVAIKRHLIEQHKEWMIRSYVVTTAFIAFRALFPLVKAAGIGTPLEAAALSSWFCWAVPLLVTEAFIQGRKILAVRSY